MDDTGFRLKEGPENRESEGTQSEASTAVLRDLSSSDEAPPILRGPSLIGDISPKRKPIPLKPTEPPEEIKVDDYDDEIECLPPSPVPIRRNLHTLTPRRAKETSDSIAKGSQLTLSPSKRLITLESYESSSTRAKLVFTDSMESCSEEVQAITQTIERESQEIGSSNFVSVVSREEEKQQIPNSNESEEFSLCVSQAPVSSQAPSCVFSFAVPASQEENGRGTNSSFEAQRILANTTADISRDRIEVSPFCTPANGHHSTPHDFTGSTEKLTSSVEVSHEVLSPMEVNRVEEVHFKFGKVVIDRKKCMLTLNMANFGFEFERVLTNLGHDMGSTFERMTNRLTSPWSGYMADVSSSSSGLTKSSTSSGGTDLLKTAISNSSRVIHDPLTGLTTITTKSRQSLSTIVLDDEHREPIPTEVSYSQVQTQTIDEMEEPETVSEHKDTPKSGRKRTKSSARKTGKKTRILTAIDEEMSGGKPSSAKRKPAAKRKLEPMASPVSTPSSAKRAKDRDSPPVLAAVSPTKKNAPLRRATKMRESIYAPPPELSPAEVEREKGRDSHDGRSSSISLGIKIEESLVAAVSDEEISSEAETAAVDLQRNTREIQIGIDVYGSYGPYFYPGKVVKQGASGKWGIDFLDGLKSELAECRILPIKFIPKGTPVYGDCPDGTKLPGIIIGYKISRSDVDYIVQLERGETMVVPRIRIVMTPQQVELLRAPQPNPQSPSALDLSNVINGKRRRTQRSDLQGVTPPTTPRRRGKKDQQLDSSTLSEAEVEVETPRLRRSQMKESATSFRAPKKNGFQTPVSKTNKSNLVTPSRPSTVETTHTPVFKQLFVGCGFLLTKKDPRPEGEEDEMSETETRHSDVKLDKATLRREIEDRGGVVFDFFSDSQMDPGMKVYLISNRACRTEKYIYALAAGYPPVHNAWITDCIERNTLLSFKNYLLPAGIHSTEVIEWTPRGRIFDERKILLVSEDENFIDFWRRTFLVAGVGSVTVFQPSILGSPVDFDFAIAKTVSEQTEEDMALLKIVRSSIAKLKGFSTNWVVFCLVHSQLLLEMKESEPLCDIW